MDDRILYRTFTGSLMAVPFDAKRKRLTGDPIRIMDGITESFGASEALSPNGTFAFKRGRLTNRLVLVDSGGRVSPFSGDDRSFSYDWASPRFSPDGRRVGVAVRVQRGDTIRSDIWLFDVATRSFTRVTSLGDVANASWTPDGRRLVFSTQWQKKPTLWIQDANGERQPEQLLQVADGDFFYVPRVTPDGRAVVVCHTNANRTKRELLYVSLSGDHKPEQLLSGPCSSIAVSPDGKWLAYDTEPDGTWDVYVRPFHTAGDRTKITQNGGDSPEWSRDGSRVYYRRSENGSVISAARLRWTGSGIEVLARDRIAAIPSAIYDITPDGKRILAIEESDSRVQLVVTTNWISRLRAQLAGIH